MNNLCWLLFIAAAYFFFHWQTLSYVDESFGIRIRRRDTIITFFINYFMFTVCSVMQFHLIANWSLFFLALWIEIWYVSRRSAVVNAYLALSAVTTGLAMNILWRCFFALALSRPLGDFNNQVLDIGNIKRYPVFLGFLFAGAVFWCYRRIGIRHHMDEILQDTGSLRFLTAVLSVLYGYLVLNLATYYSGGSEISLKLWGIKSVVFVEFGIYLSTVYCARISQLGQFQEKNRKGQEALVREKEEKEKVRILAYTDMLTGCGNRQCALEVLADAWGKKRRFCLCFLDLNGLKKVNDLYGHVEGDNYLASVATTIRQYVRKSDYVFRYGGDEFIILFYDLAPDMAKERMRQVNLALEELSLERKYPYRMTVSFGVVAQVEAKSVDSLLRLADERMYRNKKEKRK